MFESCTVGGNLGNAGFTLNKDEKTLIDTLRKAGITTESVLEVLLDWYDPEKNPADVSDLCKIKTKVLNDAYEHL